MPRVTDQTGRPVNLHPPVQRIVSLVPSQTELLAYLGLDEEVLGLTAWCVHPGGWRQKKTVVGGTKDPDREKILALQPDLVLANKEENPREAIETLAREVPVWVSDVRSLAQAGEMIRQVGELVQRAPQARQLNQEIATARQALQKYPVLPVAYYIWKDPWMLAGPDTFISAMLEAAGLRNVLPDTGERYPALDREALATLPHALHLLSSEPFAFTTGHMHALAPHLRGPVKIVDGQHFSWYGSRILPALRYLERWRREVDSICAALM